ncbi:MAG: hypothetical protein IPL46_09330 [Saprospiraceae bacterium]|nr:hypothetical protein [Saprospiraceae bacterium]
MDRFPYHIKRLSDDRLPDVKYLLDKVKGRKMSLSQLRIKYDTSHTGRQFVAHLAYDGDLPIAFYGTVPQIVSKLDGSVFIGCHAADLYSEIAYRKQGLNLALANSTFELMRDEDIPVIFGYQNEGSYQVCKRQGFSELGRMSGYLIPTGNLSFSKGYQKFHFLERWHSQKIREKFSKWAITPAQFYNSNRSRGFTVEYSTEFFKSKSFHENHLIEIEGVKFWLATEGLVRVGDVHFEEAGQLIAALEILKKTMRSLGFGNLLFQAYRQSPWILLWNRVTRALNLGVLAIWKLCLELTFIIIFLLTRIKIRFRLEDASQVDLKLSEKAWSHD